MTLSIEDATSVLLLISLEVTTIIVTIIIIVIIIILKITIIMIVPGKSSLSKWKGMRHTMYNHIR